MNDNLPVKPIDSLIWQSGFLTTRPIFCRVLMGITKLRIKDACKGVLGYRIFDFYFQGYGILSLLLLGIWNTVLNNFVCLLQGILVPPPPPLYKPHYMADLAASGAGN